MNMIRRAFTGTLAGLVLLLTALTALTPSAQAAPAHADAPSVCKTGFRGQPAYDRNCLIRGDYFDAMHVWKNAGYNKAERRAQCRTALRTGMPALVRETRGDVLYDTYRNYGAMIRLTAWAGAAECFRI